MQIGCDKVLLDVPVLKKDPRILSFGHNSRIHRNGSQNCLQTKHC
jgi:hypothetical protein